MIAVFGATGRVGGKVAAMLLETGTPVRILVRSRDKASPLINEGAEVVEGSLFNVEDIKNTMDRCEGAFLMSPLNWSSEQLVEEEIQIGKNYAEALKDSTINHIVYMSAITAREKTGIPFFESKAVIEDALLESGVDCTFLRPAFFMENLYQQWQLIQEMGIISYPFPPDTPIPMTAVEDIAYAAVQSLMRGGRGHEVYDVWGARDYTMAEVTETISRIIDMPVRYVQASPEQAVEFMMKNGLSRTAAQGMVLMFEKYNEIEFKGDREKVYNEFNYEPTSLETVLSTAAGALKAEAG